MHDKDYKFRVAKCHNLEVIPKLSGIEGGKSRLRPTGHREQSEGLTYLTLPGEMVTSFL